jgi:hypothetical protein
MQILFDGPVPVAYGQAYVLSGELPDMTAAFAGQVNGLCGAGDPGALFLMTGTHSGEVHFTIEHHDEEPPAAAAEWEDVVEVPFVPRAGTVDLVPWGDGTLAELPLTPAPRYRVRYCAAGMDEGSNPYGSFDPDEIEDGDFAYMEQRPDRYLVCFWPEASGRPDEILRQTSRAAAYWHGWAAALPAPPTLWEQVEAEEHERAERERRQEDYKRREEARLWGGRPPGERLRRVRGNVFGLAQLDRDLVDGVAEAGDATQRHVAIWAARQAFAHAGIAELDWMAPAWAALESGGPLPAEFTDLGALFVRISGTPPVSYSIVSVRPSSSEQGRHSLSNRGLSNHGLSNRGLGENLGAVLNGPVDRISMALPALTAAAGPDPLQAALESLWAAVTTYADQRPALLAEVRRAFPVVDRTGPPAL